MGKKIFLIRHGQTDYNLNGIVQGSGVDAPLNATGRQQAEAFYRHYQASGIEKIYTSALVRTHQSVDPFIRSGLPWQVVPELNEISWGKHEGKAITPEEDAYYHWLMKQWRSGNTGIGIEGGESADEVAVRMAAGLEIILNDPVEKLLVCMHGRAMRVMLCVMMGYALHRMDEFEHRNLCLYELDHDPVSGFHIAQANSVVHLDPSRLVTS